MLIPAYLITMIPTFVLLGLVGAYRWRDPRTKALWTAVILGAMVTIPVLVVETAVEDPAASDTDVYWQAFQQQVLGAAVVEEVAKCIVFLLAYLLFRHSLITRPHDIVALAVSTAIGFLTVENVLAVEGADAPLMAAWSRLLTLLAGHASLQLIMGYFAAWAFLGIDFRMGYLVLMLVVPIAIHGWGDFSETIFNYHQSLDPNSDAAKNWFTAWILALFLYVTFAVVLLWQMRYAWQRLAWNSPPPTSTPVDTK